MRSPRPLTRMCFPLIESWPSSCAPTTIRKDEPSLRSKAADGKRRYAEAVKQMTTVNVPPADVHEIGLKEVARITAEMTKLAQTQGCKDLVSFREAVNNDPRWKPTSDQQILADYKRYIHQMEPKLPELFGLLPKSP